MVSLSRQTKLNKEKELILPRGYYTLLYLPSVLRSAKTQLHSDGIRVSFSVWALFGDNRGLRFSVRQLRLAHFFNFYRKKERK